MPKKAPPEPTPSTSSLDDELLLGILEGQSRKKTTPLNPTLLVGLGGTGAAVLRRVKLRVAALGLGDAFRFLVLDMDESAREPAWPYPGFEEHEFVYLPRESATSVFEHPEAHRALVERLDLDTKGVRTALEQQARSSLPGAGQVRPIGLLGFLATMRVFRTRLSAALTDLTGRWAALEERLKGRTSDGGSLVPRAYVVLVSSVCGGTGSSTLIDVAAVVRDQLKGAKVREIAGILTLPDVYENRFPGKQAEYHRLKANAYAVLREIQHFQSGRAHEEGVALLGTGSKPLKAPERLFDTLYLVERRDAMGRDLQKDEAVYDTLGLYLTADIASTLGQRLSSSDANDLARNGLAPCPRTNLRRIYSTLSAAAVGIPAYRLLRYCVNRQAVDFLLGNTDPQEAGKVPSAPDALSEGLVAEFDGWLKRVRLEERTGDDVIDEIRGQVYAGADAFTAGLYERAGQSGRLYHSDRVFARRFAETSGRWKDTQFPDLVAKTAEASGRLTTQATREWEQQVADLAGGRGVRAALEFSELASRLLDGIRSSLEKEAAEEEGRAGGLAKEAARALKKVSVFHRQILNSPGDQDLVIRKFRDQMDAQVAAVVRREAARVFADLRATAEQTANRLRTRLEASAKLKTEFETELAASLPRAKATWTESHAEIDAATPEFFRQFYGRHAMGLGALRQALAAERADTAAASDSEEYDRRLRRGLKLVAARHFWPTIQDLKVTDLLEAEMRRGGEAASDARARVEEAVAACRPLWRADVGQHGATFSDSPFVGVPEGLTTGTHPTLEPAITAAGNALGADPRYPGTASVVATADNHRIYAVRRAHGGLPFYLQSWEELRSAYGDWTRHAHHPLHVFPASFVATLSDLEPLTEETPGERAFALGLALGWIATRGPQVYFNLDRSRTGTGYVMPLHSHFDCIPFEGRKGLRKPPGALQALVDAGMLEIANAARPDPARRLSDGKGGLGTALKALGRDERLGALVSEAFDELCGAAHDATVAEELKAYADRLAGRLRSDDAHRDLLEKGVRLLRREADLLRARGGA